jgi:FkbM family methyltransferase
MTQLSQTLLAPFQALRRLAREASQIRRFAGDRVLVRYMLSMARHSKTICRTRRLTQADIEMSMRSSYRVRVKGVDIIIPGSLFGLARELYGRMPYFAGPGFEIARGDVVVDLGANCGLFSVLGAKLGGTVYSVEAQYGFIEELRQLACVNGVNDRISDEWAIVGSRRGVLSDETRLQAASHWLGKTPRTLTTSELFNKWGIRQIDFLKVDIEGSEFDLIAEGRGVLSRVKKLAMEIHLEYGSADEIVAPLADLGFRTLLLSNELVPVRALRTSSGYVMAWRTGA